MSDDTLDSSCCTPGEPIDAPSLASGTGESELAVLAKALGHPARVRILRLLLARDTCVCGEIVAELPLAQATVSQHLKILRDSGLVQGEVDGPRICYCVDRARLAVLGSLVGELCDPLTDREVHEPLEVAA